MHIGLDGKGPTSSTGFYTGINPPPGGYTVYYNKPEEGPSITTKANDAALIAEANGVTGESMSTITEVLTYYAGQSDKIVMHNPFPEMHANSLSAYYIGGAIPSYPRSGTSWHDLSGEANNGTLTNGPTFNSNGYMDLDGVDDFISIDTYTFGNGNWTVSMVVNADNITVSNLLSNTSGGPVTNAFGFASSKIHYRNYDGAWQTHNGNTTLSTSKWYSLTWVNYAGDQASTGTMKMYVNGVADSSEFNSYATNGGPCNAIGSNWFSKFNGRIASTKFYTKSLTDAEILDNYYQGSIVTDGLKGAFDAGNLVSYENGSTTAYSLKDVSETGDLDNGVAFSSESGGTWVLDGVDDQIDFGNPSSLSNAQVTVTFWYNPTTLMNNTHGGIIKGRTPGGRFCLFWINGTTLSTQYRDDSGLSRANGGVWTRSQTATGAVSSTNQWYFIQITGNESTDEWRVVVDLNVSTTDFGSQYVDPDNNQWLLGRRASAAYDHSKIANIQIYDRVLSQGEIEQNYYANVNQYN